MTAENESQGNEPKEASYKDLMSEVETLISEVSTGDVELDAMVSKVERGYELIGTMRQRLQETKHKVEKLRLEFEESET